MAVAGGRAEDQRPWEGGRQDRRVEVMGSFEHQDRALVRFGAYAGSFFRNSS